MTFRFSGASQSLLIKVLQSFQHHKCSSSLGSLLGRGALSKVIDSSAGRT